MQDMNKGKFNSSGSGPAPKLGVKEFASGLARPGVREAKSATASSVMEANGKLARPGFHQNTKGQVAGGGSIARPGGNETISKGVNTKPTRRGKTTDG